MDSVTEAEIRLQYYDAESKAHSKIWDMKARSIHLFLTSQQQRRNRYDFRIRMGNEYDNEEQWINYELAVESSNNHQNQFRIYILKCAIRNMSADVCATSEP
jgi:hypothetical protein